jgi:hypothetical protein
VGGGGGLPICDALPAAVRNLVTVGRLVTVGAPTTAGRPGVLTGIR